MLPAFLGVLPEYPTMSEVLGFQATGLMVVFLALGGLFFILSFVGRIFAARDARAAAATAAAASSAVAPPTASSAPTDEITGPSPAVLVAIAAAVHVTLGTRARVVFVTPLRVDGDWAREGRRQIFASHRVR